jgi:hypothetical protein
LLRLRLKALLSSEEIKVCTDRFAYPVPV